MASSTGKLNPIYGALDAHQYNRAIKLASALPDTNVLGKALLAHAYTKAGQKYNALVTLNKILGGGGGGGSFFELQYEVDACLESALVRQNKEASSLSSGSAPGSDAPSSAAAAASSSNKKGKKGKKKAAPATTKQTQSSSPQQPQQAPHQKSAVPVGDDLIDQLNTPPTLPENFEALAPKGSAITDETTLGTLVVSLQAHRLNFTAFQMYASAASVMPTDLTLQKTYTLGLAVLAAPSKWKSSQSSSSSTSPSLEAYVLSHMQAVALQWARLSVASRQPSTFPVMLATSWACQSSLWQLEWLPQDEKRSLILPRLVESMSQRLIKQEADAAASNSSGGDNDDGHTEPSRSAEIQLLCLRSLRVQSKWEDMLKSIEELPMDEDDNNAENNSSNRVAENHEGSPTTSDFGVSLTDRQIQMEKATILGRLCRWSEAKGIYERLLKQRPDDWACWKGHLDCSILEEKIEDTEALVDSVLTMQRDSRVQLRGPHLMKVELASRRVQQNATSEAYQRLASSMIEYAYVFARRANCALSDLDLYLNRVLRSNEDEARDALVSLLEFAESLRKLNTSKTDDDIDNKERRYRLRAYIFSVKLTHRVLSVHPDLFDRFLPDWKEIVSEWRATLSLPISDEVKESQRDVKPNDDLMLLAIQQLLYPATLLTPDGNNDNSRTIVAAALLESAIQHSPDNPYLKFTAMEVYHQLDAPTRLWDLFQMVGLKHIQLDSCSFTVLPYLLEGGLYNETIEVCSSLLRFQNSSSQECGDYAGRAMENGTLSKADEFMAFQRNKLNQSLIFQYCKGLILDAAPLLATAVPRKKHDDDPLMKGGLGITQGIVGGADDMERAIQMTVESHNPNAALSIISWANNCGSLDDADNMSDNRDLSILKYSNTLLKPRIESKAFMVQETLRRGHLHGLLVRATLCVEAMKGPKKGKLVKPSDRLQKRTKSLMDAVLSASELLHTVHSPDSFLSLFETTIALCRFLAVVNAGMPKVDEDDSLEQREERATAFMQSQCQVHLASARKRVQKIVNVKTVYTLVPNFLVPMFAVFRMATDVCAAYGWGKRKAKTKKCAGAVADFAAECNRLVQDLMKTVARLPSSESSDYASVDINMSDNELSLLDQDVLRSTMDMLEQSRYRKRMRLEPILQQMDEFLDEFNIADG